MFVFSQLGHEGEALAYAVSLAETAALVVLIDPWLGVTAGRPTPRLAPPFDALVVTDPARAARGVFPALDLDASGSQGAGLVESGVDVDVFMRQPFAACVHDTGWIARE